MATRSMRSEPVEADGDRAAPVSVVELSGSGGGGADPEAAAADGQELHPPEEPELDAVLAAPIKPEEDGGVAGGQPAQPASNKACTHCNIALPSRWRTHPTTGVKLCNLCRAFMDRHGGRLPELVPVEERQGKWRRLPGQLAGRASPQEEQPAPAPAPAAALAEPSPAAEAVEESPAAAAAEPAAEPAAVQAGQTPRQSPRLSEYGPRLSEYGGGAAEEVACSHCGAGAGGAKQYRHPITGTCLCSKCRMFMGKHGGQLPDLDQRQEACSHCGVTKCSMWRRHPVTHLRICNVCRGSLDKHGMLPDLQPREQLATCTHCGATCVASKHYKHPATGARLCGSCRLFIGRHGGALPPVGGGGASSSVAPAPAFLPASSDRRRRFGFSFGGEESGGEEEEGGAWAMGDHDEDSSREGLEGSKPRRRCIHCTTSIPGDKWRRHPGTHGESDWLCGRCYGAARTELKQRQVQGAVKAEVEAAAVAARASTEERDLAAALVVRRQQQHAAAPMPPLPAAAGQPKRRAEDAWAEGQPAGGAAATAAAPPSKRPTRGLARPADGVGRSGSPSGLDALGAAAAAAFAHEWSSRSVLPLDAPVEAMTLRLAPLLQKCGIGEEEAQDFKFAVLALPEATQRSHFLEVQTQVVAGKPALVRRWVSRLLEHSRQQAALAQLQLLQAALEQQALEQQAQEQQQQQQQE